MYLTKANKKPETLHHSFIYHALNTTLHVMIYSARYANVYFPW